MLKWQQTKLKIDLYIIAKKSLSCHFKTLDRHDKNIRTNSSNKRKSIMFLSTFGCYKHLTDRKDKYIKVQTKTYKKGYIDSYRGMYAT